VYVDFVREGVLHERGGPAPGLRVGEASELRLCERWTSSAKSVFHFDVQGSVAKSTHAGIPWLKRLRDEAGERIHFWPLLTVSHYRRNPASMSLVGGKQVKVGCDFVF